MSNRCPLCKTGELKHSPAENRLECGNCGGVWISRAKVAAAVPNALRQAERVLYQLTDGKPKEPTRELIAAFG